MRTSTRTGITRAGAFLSLCCMIGGVIAGDMDWGVLPACVGAFVGTWLLCDWMDRRDR